MSAQKEAHDDASNEHTSCIDIFACVAERWG